jgi:NMD protein affecting ribosome stability and mRNA decay
MFKKTCYECGAKVDILFEGKCEKCYNEESPPIKEIKPLNMKYCNSCKKIHYNNQLLTIDEIKKRIKDIVKKHLVINENYKLNKLEINNFEIEGSKVIFDVKVDCDLEK